MNTRLAKKLKKQMRHEWREFWDSLFELSWRDRVRIAWALVKYRKTKVQKEEEKIWKQRRKVK